MKYIVFVDVLVLDDKGEIRKTGRVYFDETSPGDLVTDFEGFVCELDGD